jgi:hypothetical protein
MELQNGRVRWMGGLLLGQMACALVFPFVLMDAVRRGYPEYLETSAASAFSIKAGVALAVLGAALTLAQGIVSMPVLRQYSRQAAVLFVVVCGVSCAVDLMHNATVLSMLAAAEQYSRSDATSSDIYRAWGAAAGSLRRSAHIMQLLTIGAWISTFYLLVTRYGIVPRVLGILGIAGMAAQFVGVTLMMFLGNSPITYLAVPLAPILIVTAGWMIVKGKGTAAVDGTG